jgi:hypothetical protein
VSFAALAEVSALLFREKESCLNEKNNIFVRCSISRYVGNGWKPVFHVGYGIS